MRILKRFTIRTAVITIIESGQGVEVEIAGPKTEAEQIAARNYLHEEGILDAILSGPDGINFDTVNVEKYLGPRRPTKTK